MKNVDVIKKFVAGDVVGKTANLFIDGDKLVNYSTCLAERIVNGSGKVSYLVNSTKYSQSTSRIQSMIRYHISEDMIAEELEDVQMGARSLK